ncbi:D-aminoacyl-tRNA deacylase [Nitrosococcus oceani]|uniref:D-aminoacyl-tRNA deacylase n=1 Tax=Nitrosococcus oceani TaxID=1229 RepID=UPI0004E8C302|nr:D-aminoacyl-tRNA deacylase [Nitrosococcus oceani]KFI23509.1 D-tyrosyl-tRNA(Tyr) deacylase [Nitrosococcus oceani]
MIALLQRVTQAQVTVAGEVIARIGPGLVVLVGIERGDGPPQAERLLERLLSYRVFADSKGHMNLSLADVEGALLVVPQFTLAADTRKGTRPSFTPAAPPPLGKQIFEYLFTQAKARYPRCAAGRFGAHMQLSLINDGPVTFTLQIPPAVQTATTE